MTGLDADALVAGLRADTGTWRTRVHGTIGSTNDDLHAAADEVGALHGAWLLSLADAQTRGRGRLGHGWFSPAGGSINLSLGADLLLPASLWPRASLVVGLAVARTLHRLTGIDVRLKWPNDLLVRFDGRWRKLGGILCERYQRTVVATSSQHDGGRDNGALWIAGIGIDVSIAPAAFPPLLRAHVASLSWLAGAGLPARIELACAIAISVRQHVQAWQRRGGELDRDDLRERAVFLGKIVELDDGDGKPARSVRLIDIASNGGLLVEPIAGGARSVCHPLQIIAAQSEPPWQAPPRLAI